jgi:hypothetical protein
LGGGNYAVWASDMGTAGSLGEQRPVNLIFSCGDGELDVVIGIFLKATCCIWGKGFPLSAVDFFLTPPFSFIRRTRKTRFKLYSF